jgi:hypothetical protein
MIYFYAKFRMRVPIGSLVTAIKRKTKYRIHVAAMLLFCVLQKAEFHVFRSSVTMHNFRILYQVLLVSLPSRNLLPALSYNINYGQLKYTNFGTPAME